MIDFSAKQAQHIFFFKDVGEENSWAAYYCLDIETTVPFLWCFI